MIKGFDRETAPLNDYEMTELLPILKKGLERKIGKENAVTNSRIVSRLSGRYKIDGPRVRKIINYIRNNNLIECLVASSNGYYIATTEEELETYKDSLMGRIKADIQTYNSIEWQQRKRFPHTEQEREPDPDDIVAMMKKQNPAFGRLVEEFDLVPA